MAERGWAIAVATFYTELAERLVEGAQRVFSGQADVYEVPGAFELPLAARFCAEAGYEGVACLGAVIRGETDHYEYVCSSAASGILRVSLDTGVPCSFGVLTVDSMAQAEARLGEKRHQGEDAARAVVELAQLKRSL